MSFVTKDEERRVDVLVTIRPADSRWDREIARKISPPSPMEFYADSNRREIISGETGGVVGHGSSRLHLSRLISGEPVRVTIYACNPNHEWDASMKFSNAEKDGIEASVDTIEANSIAPLIIAIRPQKSIKTTLEYAVVWTPHGR